MMNLRTLLILFVTISSLTNTKGQALDLNQADSLIKAQNYLLGLKIYQEAYQSDTTDKALLKPMGECYFLLGDYANAKKCFHVLEHVDSLRILAVSRLASIYESQQNLPKAIKYFLILVKTYPLNPIYLRVLGGLYYKGNEPNQAIQSYAKSLGLNPRDAITIQALSEIYFDIDEQKSADSLSSLGLQIDSMNIGLSLLRSRIYFKQRNYAGAAMTLQKLTYQTELNNYYNKLLGYSFIQIDSLDLAIFHLRKSLLNEVSPEYSNFYLAIAFEKKKEYKEALHFYNEALKAGISGNVSQYHRGMARMHAHELNYKEVIAQYKESLRYENEGSTYFYLANASEQYYKNKNIALDYYQKFVQVKGINSELETLANQRIKALKEQRFMNKK